MQNQLKTAKEAASRNQSGSSGMVRQRSHTVLASSGSQPRLDIHGFVGDDELSKIQFYGKFVINGGHPDILVDLLTWIPYVGSYSCLRR
jgi:hypothetical protein